ncbi:N-acetylmuramic acid 6-phosphate etherase [Bacillus shivajii]|uniref:N-acetylmuramic acid 6-phosphate etherase n=1 Tax=Bacillus shivajii TaxID=1983719 RepID=UPI001CF9D04B|nr:N-acetylmuramic acid 6-phosphate etherase [Bacillus shivajii]UCZ52982.1 N-acetylmuramic acid 6-phosphate etherase [Bacillus shivajii]
MDVNLSALTTEQRNEKTKNIDQKSTIDILTLMNEEDQTIAQAVNHELTHIERTVEYVYESLKQGGTLFYIGAGTSGRLGVLDASECPPTFRTSPDTVKAIMAGGEGAMFRAVEGVEDSVEQGAEDLKLVGLTHKDVVIGIAASGRTPYAIGALNYANELGAKTIALTCNKNSELGKVALEAIEVEVGPEVLTGSTRLKAATAHKMILNMISTTSMVKLGKVYENLMVDVNASNLKLKERAKSIVKSVTDVSDEKIATTLKEAENDVKVAIVMLKANVNVHEAKELLIQNEGFVRKAIESVEGN